MKILLDECVPRKFKNEFEEHDCRTAQDSGFGGEKNGRLLSLAESAGFELFVTMDKGLRYQQNLVGRSIAILILRAKSNRLRDLLPHVEACRLVMRSIQPGELVRVGE